MAHNLTGHVYVAPFEDNTEYKFCGEGYSSPGSRWEPPDSEMELTKCEKYTEGDKDPMGNKIWREYDLDKAIGEIAAQEDKTVDQVVDFIVSQLWDNADYDDDYPEPDYDD